MMRTGYLADYGRLYNWYAVNTGNLCPTGWHVPTDAEYTTLTDGLGGTTVAGDAMKSSASDSPAWNGTNSSGFSGLAGGVRGSDGDFDDGRRQRLFLVGFGRRTFACGRILNGGTLQSIGAAQPTVRFSVRCVRD